MDGTAVAVDASLSRAGVLSLIVDGRQYACVLDGDAVVVQGRRFPFAVHDPRELARRGRAAGDEQGPRAVRAPMPGRVVRVLVAEGDEVAAQQGVVVIEAMKMQNELKAARDGRVAEVRVAAGEALCTVHSNSESRGVRASKMLMESYRITDALRATTKSLVHRVIRGPNKSGGK